MILNYWKTPPWRYKATEVGCAVAAIGEMIRYNEAYRYSMYTDWSDINRIVANIGVGMLFGYTVGAVADLISGYNKDSKVQELFDEARRNVLQRQRPEQDEDP